jgi:hypothetical protein
MITEEGSHAAVSLPGCHASRHVNYVPLLMLDCCHVHTQMTLTRYLTQVNFLCFSYDDVISLGARYHQRIMYSIHYSVVEM